jgi:hypothetical protein
MAVANALFVRIRNAEGKYLGGQAPSFGFFEDINQAITFDCRRDDLERRLEDLRLAYGIVLEAVPVDPKEIHESCDLCGRLLLPWRAFFDGRQYLCPACRDAARGPKEP